MPTRLMLSVTDSSNVSNECEDSNLLWSHTYHPADFLNISRRYRYNIREFRKFREWQDIFRDVPRCGIDVCVPIRL